MAAVPSNQRLQSMLQTAVQGVRWTYSVFWQFSPQGVLVWEDGYYNGPIKTRKTVQPMEVSAEEASLHRSQQLRELYDSLSAGESNQSARRPSAALAPEDLTETEWFYLMCVSFSFSPGIGLPGKAYSRRQHVWLAGANEVDSKVFSRAILAKSARIQTVVCIPELNGVVELGTTDLVDDDDGFIQRVKGYFVDNGLLVSPSPRPTLSEHSTSNPSSSAHLLVERTTPEEENKEEEEDEDDDEEEDNVGSDVIPGSNAGVQNAEYNGVEQIELMQLEMSEDIRIGSPDDGSNNLDSEFRPLFPSRSQCPPYQVNESTRQRPPVQDAFGGGALHSAPSGDDDTHYSQTVTTILNHQSTRLAYSSTGDIYTLYYSTDTTFSTWNSFAVALPSSADDTSQLLLKFVLFNVPYLHAKSSDIPCSRIRKGAPSYDLSANHVLAERRRREKLNERFVILRSLVPCVTKMDKASILGDTIEYLKQLRRKIQELEARAREVDPSATRVGVKSRRTTPRLAEPQQLPHNPIEVSIIEADALIEIHSAYREGLLLDVMQTLRELRVEITAVQSSLNNGALVAELRAKVRENVNGKRASIVEVKRAINQIVPHGV